MRDLELMAPEMEKQKELLAEFARNNADLELEYKVRQITVLLAPSFALTLPFLPSRTVLPSILYSLISPYHPIPKTHSHSSQSSSFLSLPLFLRLLLTITASSVQPSLRQRACAWI
jgi:hypothetical protein